MKTKHLVLLLIALQSGLPARGENPQSTRPEPLRWHRYAYEINSTYPYLKTLPDWSEIPTLLKWINRDDEEGGIGVAYSQVVALSRVDFGCPPDPPAGGLSARAEKYYRTQRNEAWATWWETVGKAYGERLLTRGRQDPDAWKLVTRDKAQPLPDYKITIPDEWVIRTSYRAGDYGGRQSESLTLRRTKEKATLIRALRKSTRGRLEWEQWEPLTVEQADTFAFAVAYAIDNPWLLKPKPLAGPLAKLEGRDLSLYVPGFQYEFADTSGNLWWNDDPVRWYGQYPDSSMRSLGGPGLGSVCLLLWRSFPDNPPAKAREPNAAGWKPLKIPNATVLQQLAEDLTLRGEIIDILWHTQRLEDGLEALAEFGTVDQIPAINQFHSQLQARVKKAARVIAEDINGDNLIIFRDRLLVAATKAGAAIRKRIAGQK